MRNIVLIGMPASGKVQSVFTCKPGKGFYRYSLLIQAREGALLQDIIMDKGIMSSSV